MNILQFPTRIDGPIAITGVNVVPMTSPEVLRRRTVVIEDCRIKQMGPTSEIDTSGMHVIAAQGKYLMPGLADMHVHYWDIGEAELFLANGVTTVRNMWGHALHLALEKRIEEGRQPGPRVITTSPLVDGLGPQGKTLWPNSHAMTEPSQARDFIERYAQQGYRQIKAYQQLTPEVLRALGQAAREAGVRMVGHCPNDVTYEEAIASGMSCFEHLTGIFTGHLTVDRQSGGGKWDARRWLEDMRMIAEHADLDSIRRLASMMREQEVWNCPTATVWQGGVRGAEAMSDPRMDYVLPSTAAWWNPAFRGIDPELRVEFVTASQALVDRRIEVLSILREEGAPVLLGTDTPNPFVFQGFSIHDEIDNFLSAGFSPFEALRCGTFEAARFVGQESVWGTVAKGMRADLLIVDGNPLEDASVLRRPHGVLSNGFFFARADLDALLENRANEVRCDPELLPVELEPHHEDGHEIRMKEVRNGSVVGKACCRTIPRPEGLLIEERYATSVRDRRTVSITLDTDRKLERLHVAYESPFGTESTTLEKTDAGYKSTTKEVDGYERVSELESPSLYPAEALGFSVMPAVLSALDPSVESIDTVGLHYGSPVRVPVDISRSETEGDIEYKLDIKLLASRPTKTYRVGRDGELRAVEESIRGGLRAITIETDGDRIDSMKKT